MEVRLCGHTAYRTEYHIVWIPKYRKTILGKEVAGYLKEIFGEIAEQYEFNIDTMEIVSDHVHIFVEVPPKYSPARVVQIMKSISAKEIFKKYPELRKQLWSGELWNDGYFVRNVGDEVTADVIRKYIEYQTHEITPSK